MLRLAFDFIITWRETRTRPNAYKQAGRKPLTIRRERVRDMDKIF